VTALLDVNTLVALAWPNHVHHAGAVTWFKGAHRQGWATCPVTESGFMRVCSNRRAIPTAVPVADAVEMLRRLRTVDGHEFWSDDVSLAVAGEIDVDRLQGYRQVTDAHLLALAIRRDGTLVTFDGAIARLAPAKRHLKILTA
jgi:uncharacterized protein